jgi:ATP-dependent helicase HrpA
MASIDALVKEYETKQGKQIRTKTDFKAACELVRMNINDQALVIAQKIEKGMTIAHQVQKQCKGNIPMNLLTSIGSIKGQLTRLVYKGFVFDFGIGRLDDWNRYMTALQHRFDKLKVDPNRDRMNQLEVDKAQGRFDDVVTKYQKLGEAPSDLDDIVWMIEEFKVSLFAQQLGTSRPISLKRISNALAEL